MSVEDHEMQATLARIAAEHDPDALRLMTMYHFCSSLLDIFSRQHGVSMVDQLATFDRVVRFFADHHGITLDKRIAADSAIRRASRTIAELDALPR